MLRNANIFLILSQIKQTNFLLDNVEKFHQDFSSFLGNETTFLAYSRCKEKLFRAIFNSFLKCITAMRRLSKLLFVDFIKVELNGFPHLLSSSSYFNCLAYNATCFLIVKKLLAIRSTSSLESCLRI